MTVQTRRRVAIVTGAGNGIGAACAERLAIDGHLVVLADLDTDAAARVAADLATEAHVRPLDIADVEAVRELIDEVHEAHGHVDILVNNAGVAIARPLLEHTVEDWTRQVDINLRGMFFATQAAGRHMVAAGSGNIVNIASTAAFVSSSTPESIYDITKGGVRQLTVSAAVEFAPHGVNVNAVAPGTIATRLTTSVLDTPEKMAAAEAKIPARRLGTPADIANAVSFLASPDSAYIHGQVIVVDGGWLLL